MARKFVKMIFLGAGEFSVKDCKLLHERLEEGLEWLSGVQQPGDPTEPCTVEKWREQEREVQNKCSAEIMGVIADIATALGADVRCTDDEQRFILEVTMKCE